MRRTLRLIALAIALIATNQLALAYPVVAPPPYCGDPCDTPGQSRGCVYYSWGGALAKTPCTCTNGYWVCGL